MLFLYISKEEKAFANGGTKLKVSTFQSATIAKPRLVVRHSKTHLVNMKVRDEKLKAIIDWSKTHRDIRAVLFTKTKKSQNIK